MNQTNEIRQVKFNKNKVKVNDFNVKLDFTKLMSETSGQWLKDLRLAQKLSQQHLADDSGVTKATISLLENNKITQPRLDNLDSIAKRLKVPKDEMRRRFAEENLENKASRKPKTVSEFIHTLSELGFDIQFDANLEQLTPEDLQDLLDNIKANLLVKVERRKKNESLAR